MRVRVKLVRPFRDAVGRPEVEIDARAKGLVGVIGELVEAYPALREHLYEAAALSPYVNIYVNAEPVPVDEAPKVVLEEGDELLFLLPLTGGARAGRRAGPRVCERDNP